MNTTNPYIYKLPTAETGMNVRGPRNQLARQEEKTRNVGTWFQDAGKWLLNTLVSPIELVTGTNFYDPEMSHSGWQGFDDVFEGTAKGVGDALGYVYGGPMYAGMKEAGTGIADAAGLEDQVAGAQYGGKIKKAQDSFTTSNTRNFTTQAQLDNYNNIMGQFQSDPRFMQAVYGNQGVPTNLLAGGVQTLMGSPGNVGGGQTPQNTPQQPGTTPTSGQDYFKNMQNGSQYMSGPDSAQGWSGAVMEAASNPSQAIGNLAGSIANAGKDPVVAKDYKTYRDITANTGSHPGDLIKSTADIIAGVDPVSYAFQKKHQDQADIMGNAKKGMRASGFRGMQYGGTMENPYLRTSAMNQRSKAQGGGDNMANKIGQAIQHIGGTVGESLSGLGMGGGGGQGGGMGGMMDMFGGGEGGGGMMDMFSGGGGEGGGGMMDMFSGMMGGGEGGGGGFNMSSIMNMFQQNGGRVPVRKGKSPYIATHYYQNGTKVRPAPSDPLLKVDRSKVSADTIRKSNAQQMQNFGKPNITRTSPVTEQERLDAMINANSDASRLMNSLGGGLPEPNMEMRNQHRMNEIDFLKSMYEGSNEDFLNQGISNEDFLNQPFQYGGKYREYQNGGRLEKTSNLPMDMEGFTDLEPGFNRSNTIEINSGNNHSDLDNPHTPLNVPVPSFDGQGNAMTENVQILAEKGEFARKDPETEAVTIFSKNLKTKDSSGKRTNYAKIAEKLGKKEDRLMEKAKNPFDDIADASIQRALSNVKNKFIRLEEEQKVAKEVKEEEDRMDLMQLAKNGGRITKKNTYRMGGKVKTLSEYQKDLLGMDDQGQMPMAQNGSVSSDTADDAYFADPTVEDNTFAELFEDEEARKKAKEEPLKDKEKQKEFNKRYREERRQERKDERSGKQEQRYLERERRKLRKRGGEDVSELAKQIKELPGGGSEKVLDPYTNEGARKAKELIENEYRPLDTKGGLPCPPCEDGSIPSRDSEGNCLDCYSLAPEDEQKTQQKQQQRRASSGNSAINDYINNLRGINADVENRFEPYPNFFEDYGRESESIARNAINDLPEWYMDRASQLASANVNSLENAIRNMGQSMGTSGYLAQMQAAKNKELAANQGYAAQAVGQREQQLGKLSALMAQNELYDRTGAEQSFDRTQEARDAIDAAKYDTEKNILTGRLAQTREENAARRNELLDSQMQWMYNNDRTQYDKDGNPVNPGPANKGYGGKIKRDMYEYGSRVKRERQMKSDKAINEFRSFMRGFNKK